MARRQFPPLTRATTERGHGMFAYQLISSTAGENASALKLNGLYAQSSPESLLFQNLSFLLTRQRGENSTIFENLQNRQAHT